MDIFTNLLCIILVMAILLFIFQPIIIAIMCIFSFIGGIFEGVKKAEIEALANMPINYASNQIRISKDDYIAISGIATKKDKVIELEANNGLLQTTCGEANYTCKYNRNAISYDYVNVVLELPKLTKIQLKEASFADLSIYDENVYLSFDNGLYFMLKRKDVIGDDDNDINYF